MSAKMEYVRVLGQMLRAWQIGWLLYLKSLGCKTGVKLEAET